MTRAAPRGNSARLFIAAWPDAATLQALRALAAALPWPPGARLVAPHRLHLTLHFIGMVDERRVDEIAGVLVLPPRAAFEIGFTRLAAWRHGLAVLEPAAAPPALAALHADLATPLRACGLPLERGALRAHVTLAREAAGFDAAAWSGTLRWPVCAYSLVHSHPALGYRRLRDYPLDPG